MTRIKFVGIPLESTDGERLSKCKECKSPTLCINPYHVVIHVKELEVYLVNFINNTRKSTLPRSSVCGLCWTLIF